MASGARPKQKQKQKQKQKTCMLRIITCPWPRVSEPYLRRAVKRSAVRTLTVALPLK